MERPLKYSSTQHVRARRNYNYLATCNHVILYLRRLKENIIQICFQGNKHRCRRRDNICDPIADAESFVDLPLIKAT